MGLTLERGAGIFMESHQRSDDMTYIDKARLAYLKAENKLGDAKARHIHCKSDLTAELLAEARKNATAAWQKYNSIK